MFDVSWFALKTDTFNDTKIKLIKAMPNGDTIIVIFIQLIALAAKQFSRGLFSLTEETPYTIDMLAVILDRPKDVVSIALKTLMDFRMIIIDENGLHRIANFEKHQNIEALERAKELHRKRQAKYRERLAEKNKEPDDEADVTSRVTPLVTSPVTPSVVASVIQSDVTDKKRKEKKRKEKSYPEESVEYRLSSLLFELIKERDDKHKEPNFQNWAHQIHLLIEKDNRSPETVEEVLRYSQTDKFWKKNILSTETLRRQFGTLYIHMTSDKEKNGRINNNANKEPIINQPITESNVRMLI